MNLYVIFFAVLCFLSILMTFYLKIIDKVPFYKNFALAIFLVTAPIVFDGVTDPYFVFSCLTYRVDNMKEYSITSRSYDNVEVYFNYYIQTDTIFGTKVIPLTSEQFSNIKIGDYVDTRGNKVIKKKNYTEENPIDFRTDKH